MTTVFGPALAVADAVLYEGYLLYPYTASTPKNRVRWQFGVVVPQAYAGAGTGEPAEQQTEILIEAGPTPPRASRCCCAFCRSRRGASKRRPATGSSRSRRSSLAARRT